jgi:hypothetical protein
LEDILGQGSTTKPGSTVSSTKYFRVSCSPTLSSLHVYLYDPNPKLLHFCIIQFDPIIGTSTDFPIDGTDPIRLAKLSQIATNYMNEPEQQEQLKDMGNILRGKFF